MNSNDSAPASDESAALLAELDKWKSLSHAANAELETLRQGHTARVEESAEQVRAEARKAMLAEIGPRLVEAEIKAQAAQAEIEITDLRFMDFNQFLTPEGTVNVELVGELIKSRNPKPLYSQDLGLGRQGGPIQSFSFQPRSLDARYR
ncbi:hypothetical protein ABTZ03_30470 [Kitasatospora sp. NPDC096077]|uniref:hypothetical protein n=1 Tax=Kitasatospora sp. NPDC096077 TaxID=3155544 RepID=UPI003330513D